MGMRISKFIEPADVIIVQMPFASLARPSIGLGLLKGALSASELSCSTIHANLLFAEFVGIDDYLCIKEAGTDMLLGEWLFSSALFEDFRPDDDVYLTEAAIRLVAKKQPRSLIESKTEEQKQKWRRIRSIARDFVRELSEAIICAGPRIVGCTSMFEQHTASLALLKQIKESDPAVKAIIGGANCAGAMAAATVLEFPWVDVAFSGEADDVFLELCRTLLSGKGAMPKGAVTRSRAAEFKKGDFSESELWADQVDMEKLPLPDYGEYFTTLSRLSYRCRVNPGLVLEGSRGCWWRPDKSCAFCSLNPGHRKHRSKSAGKTLGEFSALSEKHGVKQFQMTDNIVPTAYFEKFFPLLMAQGRPYKLFYETPPILSRARVEAMSLGGVTWVQSGIEALDDDVLALMNKGSSAIGSIATLKHFAEFGMKVVWHLLTGTPGENGNWHLRVVAMLPLLHHLPPPFSTIPITFFRHSSYHEQPELHGLDLLPAPAYSVIYPLDSERAKSLVFLFADKAQITPGSFLTHKNSREAKILKSAAGAWLRISRAPAPPVLCSMEQDGVISVIDTRPCAVAMRHVFDGLEAEILRHLVEPVSVSDIPSLVGASQESTGESLCKLKLARLIIEISGKALSLLVPGNALPAPPASTFPGGYMHGSGMSAGAEEVYPGEKEG